MSEEKKKDHKSSTLVNPIHIKLYMYSISFVCMYREISRMMFTKLAVVIVMQ